MGGMEREGKGKLTEKLHKIHYYIALLVKKKKQRTLVLGKDNHNITFTSVVSRNNGNLVSKH